VREIGCSNFSVEQLREAEAAVHPGAARFVSVQNEYNLLHRDPERDVIPECRRLGMAFLPFFPLASGLLTGKYRQGQPPPEGSRLATVDRFAKTATDRALAIVESLFQFATSHGHTLLELAISWLARHPTVASVIAGATSPQQVKTNAAGARWAFTAEESAEVEELLSRSG
jgi:aryl-alcohol dehydrogenase-like predicted oxidoreductase